MYPSSKSCILGENKYSNDEGKHTHTINGHSNDKKWSFAAGAASNLMGLLLGRYTEGGSVGTTQNNNWKKNTHQHIIQARGGILTQDPDNVTKEALR